MWKIAVVDDEQDNLDVFKFLFRSIEKKNNIQFEKHFILHDTGCCKEDVILDIEPDIVFMDIKMAGLSGVEIYDRLRTLGYEKPIIAQTASVTSFEIEVYQEIFTDGILKKPLDEEQIEFFLKKYDLLSEAGNENTRND